MKIGLAMMNDMGFMVREMTKMLTRIEKHGSTPLPWGFNVERER